MKQIAIYGKGGIGKSTITSNLSAALAERGQKVLQIGCDPKHDSTKLLLGGICQQTVLDKLRTCKSAELDEKDIVLAGFKGIHCIEAGGPEPGVGCAGRGILAMDKALTDIHFDKNIYDLVIYDVLGDVVCGGFAVPMRDGYADEVYIVTSGEIMSLYAANNIAKGLMRFGGKLAGIIGNSKNLPSEESLLRKFARSINSKLVAFIPRDNGFLDAEHRNTTVIESFPETELANVFRKLAAEVLQKSAVQVKPLSDQEFDNFVKEILGKEKEVLKQITKEHLRASQKQKIEFDFDSYLSSYKQSESYDDTFEIANQSSGSRLPLYCCSLAGAYSAVNHIEDSITIMHSPPNCANISLFSTYLAGYTAYLKDKEAPRSQMIPRLACTNLQETDLIYGAEKKLTDKVNNVIQEYSPSAVFLITSCPTGLVGDDSEKAIKAIEGISTPIIPIPSDGILKGDYSQGVVNAYEQIAKNLIFKHKASEKDPSLINIVGENSIGPEVDRNFKVLSDLLAMVGLKVNARFLRKTSVETLKKFDKAKYSLNVSFFESGFIAKNILEAYSDTIFLDIQLPVGYKETLKFIEELSEITGKLVSQEHYEMMENQKNLKLARLKKILNQKKILLSVYAMDISWFNELIESLDFDLCGIAILASPCLESIGIPNVPSYSIKNSDELAQLVSELKPDLLLSNYLPRKLPKNIRASTIPLSPPFGYLGVLELAEGFARSFTSMNEGWRSGY